MHHSNATLIRKADKAEERGHYREAKHMRRQAQQSRRRTNMRSVRVSK